MKLFRYYKKAVLYPSIFILFFCIVYALIDNYKSDPLPLKSVIQMSIVPSLIYALLICALSATIFLNKIQKLNKNIIWNLFAWFLLPFVYILIILVQDFDYRIKHGFGFGNDWLYLLIMTVPYIIGLYCTFINYRKEITISY